MSRSIRSTRLAVWTLPLLVACGSDEPAASPGITGVGGTNGTAGSAGASVAGQAGQAGTGAAGGGQSGAGAGTAGQGGSVMGGAGQGGATSNPSSSLRAALDADGFDVQDGAFSFLDLSSCCDTSCLGNNPSSPYGAFFLPKAPGQTVENGNPDVNGRTPTYRLRADEALIYVGKTPAKAKYFGFTPYLSQRIEGGKTKQPLASLSETLNQIVIGVDDSLAPGSGAFDKPTVVIGALDQGVDARIRKALVAAGYPASSFNTLVFDPTKTRPGLGADADTFSVLFRMALPEDAAAAAAYRAAPPGYVLRVTPRAPAPAAPFASPPARAKNTSNSESSLTSAVDELETAIAAAYPTHNGKTMVITAGQPDPDACIAGTDACAYDNRDTIYPATVPQKLLDQPGDFVIVYGVDHAVSGKATYGSASVYSLEHLYGAAAVSSVDYAGSASTYLPNNPQAPKLYAWKIARDCQGEAHCLSVPVGSCPDGIATDALISLAFRVYLEPTTGTAADPSTLVIDRVMKFSQKKL